MIEKTNRFYSQNFCDELHSLFIYYNQKVILSKKQNEKNWNKPLNFLHIKHNIKVYHFSSVKNNRFCLLEPLVFKNINSWSEIMILFITQLIFLKIYPAVEKRYDSCKVTNTYQSIVFFLENRLHYYKMILQGEVVPCIHPESIIRKIRLQQLDSCTLHILRQILYGRWMETSSDHEYLHFYVRLLKDNCLNLIFEEFDQVIRNYCHQIQVNIKSVRQDIILDKWNTLRFKKIVLPVVECIPTSSLADLTQFYTIHYSRYDYTCWYFADGSPHLIKLMYKRMQRFVERRLGCYSQKLYIYSQKDICHLLKWYFKIGIYSYHVLAWIRAKYWLTTTSLPYLVPFMTTNSLTKILSAYNICNHDGYPLTKNTWIQWDDIQIIRYFETMYDDYYWNYNGVINYKMTLTYLSYIIRYSCAKTLAFKHKRSLRFILEYNDNYRRFIKFHRLRENQLFLRRLWHLDI